MKQRGEDTDAPSAKKNSNLVVVVQLLPSIPATIANSGESHGYSCPTLNNGIKNRLG